MSSTSFAEGISVGVTKVFTKMATLAQDFLWGAAQYNARFWLWVPLWLEIVILIFFLVILFGLVRYAWLHREFWTEIIEGKF